jgi:hypothetical protein
LPGKIGVVEPFAVAAGLFTVSTFLRVAFRRGCQWWSRVRPTTNGSQDPRTHSLTAMVPPDWIWGTSTIGYLGQPITMPPFIADEMCSNRETRGYRLTHCSSVERFVGFPIYRIEKKKEKEIGTGKREMQSIPNDRRKVRRCGMISE